MCIGLGLQGITQIASFWCKKGGVLVQKRRRKLSLWVQNRAVKRGLQGARADHGNILNLENYPFNNAGIPADAGAAETV